MAGVSHRSGGAVPAPRIDAQLDVDTTYTVAGTGPNGLGQAGDVVTYTTVVTNTGRVAVDGVTVTDTLGTNYAPAGPFDLAPGESVTVTGTYVLTPADIEAEQVPNTATATGTSIGGTATGTDPATVTDPDLEEPPAPDVSVDVTSAVTGTGDLGDEIVWTIVITNDGDEDATGVNLAVPGDVTLDAPGPYTVPAGGSITITGTQPIDEPIILAGIEEAPVTVSGGSPTGDTFGPVDANGGTVPEITTPDIAAPAPSFQVTSGTPTVTGDGDLGDSVQTEITITNDGNVTLEDLLPALPPGATIIGTVPGSLAPGESFTIIIDDPITEDDILAGTTGGTPVTIAPTSPTGVADPAPVTETTPPVTTAEGLEAPAPSVSIVPTLTTTGGGDVGDTIAYSIVITNDGNTTLTDLVVDDPNVVLSPSPIASLAPGESVTVTGTRIITPEDIAGGTVSEVITVTGDTPAPLNGDDVVLGTSIGTTSVPLAVPNPVLSVAKSGVVNAPGDVGDTVDYTIEVTNTGNSDAVGVTPNDPLIPALTPASVALLAAGDSATFTGSYTIQPNDLVVQQILNTVSVAFTDVNAVNMTPATASATIDAADGLAPADTDAPVLSGCQVGSQTYIIGQAIVPFQVSADEDVTWTDSGLPAGLTATVIDARTVEISGTPTGASGGPQTFTVTATDVSGNTQDCVTTYVAEAVPTITAGCPTGGQQQWIVGEPITASTLVVDDPEPGGTWRVATGLFLGQPALPLPAGVTLDANTGELSGTPTSTSTPGFSVLEYVTAAGTVSGNQCFVSRVVDSRPILALTKSITNTGTGTGGAFRPGDVIEYSINVSNTGTLSADSLVVTDPDADSVTQLVTSVTGSGGALLATAVHTVTAAEATAGSFTNTAALNGVDAQGVAFAEVTASATATTEEIPETLDIDVEVRLDTPPANGTHYVLGEDMPATVYVTNNSDVAVTVGGGDLAYTGGPTFTGSATVTLQPGETAPVFTGNYVVDAAGVTAGQIDWTATWSAASVNTGTAVTATSPVATGYTVEPAAMDVVITSTLTSPANGTAYTEGEVIQVSVQAQNTGQLDWTLTSLAGPDWTVATGSTPVTVSSGDFAGFTLAHTVTAAEAAAGSVNLMVTGIADNPLGGGVLSAADSISFPAMVQEVQFTVDKAEVPPTGTYFAQSTASQAAPAVKQAIGAANAPVLTPATDVQLTQVGLWLESNTGASESVTLEIHQGVGVGTVIATSLVTSVAPGEGQAIFDWASPVSLTAGQSYTFIATGSAVTSGDILADMRVGDTSSELGWTSGGGLLADDQGWAYSFGTGQTAPGGTYNTNSTVTWDVTITNTDTVDISVASLNDPLGTPDPGNDTTTPIAPGQTRVLRYSRFLTSTDVPSVTNTIDVEMTGTNRANATVTASAPAVPVNDPFAGGGGGGGGGGIGGPGGGDPGGGDPGLTEPPAPFITLMTAINPGPYNPGDTVTIELEIGDGSTATEPASATLTGSAQTDLGGGTGDTGTFNNLPYPTTLQTFGTGEPVTVTYTIPATAQSTENISFTFDLNASNSGGSGSTSLTVGPVAIA